MTRYRIPLEGLFAIVTAYAAVRLGRREMSARAELKPVVA
jgi:hypothetical protein